MTPRSETASHLGGCGRGGSTILLLFVVGLPKRLECPLGGRVAGTTALVADRLGRNAILIELNRSYAAMARRRIEADAGMFAAVAD
jgi:hypothetical protein